jgi:UDP-glucuronate decarboxylase
MNIMHKETRTASDIVAEDLSDIGQRLSFEFGKLSGRKLLIVGGGGFLGYYLIDRGRHAV